MILKPEIMIRTKKTESDIALWARKLTWNSIINQKQWKNFWDTNDNVPSTKTYNLTICDAPKFIWFRNAKVSTRSTLKALSDTGVKLIAEQAANCYYAPQKYKDYFKFAFVRNPWDRFVSGWRNKVVDNNYYNFNPQRLAEMQQFDRFVEYFSGLDLDNCDIHFRRQSRIIDLNEVDFIGRFEQFNEDLEKVFRILELPLVQIPMRNKSKGKDSYQSYYSDNNKQIIEEMYRIDIQIFGYSY